MTALAMFGGIGSSNLNASQTVYQSVAEGFPGGVNDTTEDHSKITWRTAGIFSMMSMWVGDNDRGASTRKFRKDTGSGSADGNQTLSIGASTTGLFQDAINTDSVNVGDKVGASIAIGAGGTKFRAFVASILFAATTNSLKRYATLGSGGTFAPSSVWFPVLAGSTIKEATEAVSQVTLRAAGTLQNLFVNIAANSLTATTTMRTRIGGVNGNQSVSIGSGATGIFEDNVNTDAVVSGNLVNYRSDAGGTGTSLQLRIISVEFLTTGTAFDVSGAAAESVFAAGSTYAVGLSGSLGELTSNFAESYSQIPALLTATLSRMRIRVGTNSTTGAGTWTLRKNLANGNNTISIGAGVTGFLEDTTHTDSVGPTDTLNYLVVSGTGGLSQIDNTHAILFTLATPSASIVPQIMHGRRQRENK